MVEFNLVVNQLFNSVVNSLEFLGGWSCGHVLVGSCEGKRSSHLKGTVNGALRLNDKFFVLECTRSK